MTDEGWRIAAASVIGTSHLKQGTVCQDYHACRLFKDADRKPVAVLVASDGAGSAAQANEGSFLACRTIVEAVEVHLAADGRVAEIGGDTVRSWVTLVQDAIAHRANEAGAVPRDYACTLLAAIVGDNDAAFLQIGDGAIVVSDLPGEWAWIHWPQRGEFANTTYFVTDENAADCMAFDLVERTLDEVALFTDGIESLVLHYASKAVHDPFFNRMFLPVRALVRGGLDTELSRSLEDYLGSQAVCARTHDDKTLILATRRLVLSAESENGSE